MPRVSSSHPPYVDTKIAIIRQNSFLKEQLWSSGWGPLPYCIPFVFTNNNKLQIIFGLHNAVLLPKILLPSINPLIFLMDIAVLVFSPSRIFHVLCNRSNNGVFFILISFLKSSQLGYSTINCVPFLHYVHSLMVSVTGETQ